MKKEGKLITPRKEFQNEFNELLQSIADFMIECQDKGFKLDIDARVGDDYKTLRAELYKPLVDVDSTDFFEKKEVSDEK